MHQFAIIDFVEAYENLICRFFIMLKTLILLVFLSKY